LERDKVPTASISFPPGSLGRQRPVKHGVISRSDIGKSWVHKDVGIGPLLTHSVRSKSVGLSPRPNRRTVIQAFQRTSGVARNWQTRGDSLPVHGFSHL